MSLLEHSFNALDKLLAIWQRTATAAQVFLFVVPKPLDLMNGSLLSLGGPLAWLHACIGSLGNWLQRAT
jgi:hypothetical protein